MAYVFALDRPLGDATTVIGGKAANLAVMAGDLGLPVPPGFAISTEACRVYLAGGWPADLDDEVRQHLARLADMVGLRFGDADNPLLVSVRSGAPVSMPGMMDTILNLGLTPTTAAGLAKRTGRPDFAAACRARFESTYRDIVGVSMVPEDPWAQLRGAIEAVFRSWNSDRARSYRRREHIPDSLGTGVIVQAMVFGNLGLDSATGVLFTRNPATGEDCLYGDVLFDAQGEDVVSGTHATEPIAVLGERMPEIAEQLREYARRLERHYADVCDIEFTIEDGRLWMLQTRIGKRSPQAAVRIAREMAEDADFPLSREAAVRRVAHLLAAPATTTLDRDSTAVPVARGLAACPGVASGKIATTADDAVAMSAQGSRAILVRRETSPDDVHGIARAAGLLTACGGLASHAAVVARGWGIPAVVGTTALDIAGSRVTIGGQVLAAGDVVTIDGSTGYVYLGAVGSVTVVPPDAAVLLAWARELAIEVGADQRSAAAAATPVGPDSARGGTGAEDELSDDAVLHTLRIKGSGTAADLAPVLFSTAERVDPVLQRLADEGLLKLGGGTYRISDDGRWAADALLAADRERLGVARATAALDHLVSLDRRIKEIVTAWQMRTVDGAPVLNDHSDAAYDSGVLADFAALHRAAAGWLGAISDAPAQLDRYLARLDRAAARVAEGEHVYLASPRVDSYHSIWFELHQELILLAGRTRADETAAGRA